MEKNETIEIINQLRNLQELDIDIRRRHEEEAVLPARKKEVETSLENARQAVALPLEEVKSRQSALRQTELDVESLRQQIGKLRTQQFEIKSNNEYRALNREIEHLEGKIGRSEDDALKIMEEIDQLRSKAGECEQILKKEQERVAAEHDRIDKRQQVLIRELSEITARRGNAAAKIPTQWLPAYERVMANKKDYALVGLDANGICGGCHMKLNPQTMHDVRKAETILSCVFCGRLLFDNH